MFLRPYDTSIAVPVREFIGTPTFSGTLIHKAIGGMLSGTVLLSSRVGRYYGLFTKCTYFYLKSEVLAENQRETQAQLCNQ